MDPAPPPQGRSRHAISGHHRRHAPGPGAELHEGYGNRTGRNRLPARLLVTGSIPARIQALDRRSTRAISPADETAKAGLKRVPSRAPILTRHGCSYNQYPALRFNTPERDLVLPVGAPPTVRTAIEPRLRASRPFAPDTGAPTINIRRWGSIPRKGIWRTCRSIAPGANRNRTKPQSQPHSHPTRVLLQSISGVGVQCPEWDLVLPVGAPHRCEPQSNRTSEPGPIRTRHGCSYGGYGVVTFGVGAPPSV